MTLLSRTNAFTIKSRFRAKPRRQKAFTVVSQRKLFVYLQTNSFSVDVISASTLTRFIGAITRRM